MPDEAPARDPYLCWAKHTGWSHVLREPGTGLLAVAIECAGTVSDLVRQKPTGVHIAEHYRQGGVIDPKAIRYCTALVDPSALASLEARVRRLKLGMGGGPPWRAGDGGTRFEVPDQGGDRPDR